MLLEVDSYVLCFCQQLKTTNMMCAQARGILRGLPKPGALAYPTSTTAPYRLWSVASLRQDKNAKASHHGPFLAQKMKFSTSKQQSSRNLLPPLDSRKIKETKIIWHHPMYDHFYPAEPLTMAHPLWQTYTY